MIVEGSKEFSWNWRLILTFPLTLLVVGLTLLLVFASGQSATPDRDMLLVIGGLTVALFTMGSLILHVPVALVLERGLSPLGVPVLILLSLWAIAVSLFCIVLLAALLWIDPRPFTPMESWLYPVGQGMFAGLVMGVFHLMVYPFRRRLQKDPSTLVSE